VPTPKPEKFSAFPGHGPDSASPPVRSMATCPVQRPEDRLPDLRRS
jgi:hypothetical protein